MGSKYINITPAKDDNKVIKFNKMDLKYCRVNSNEFIFIVIKDSIRSSKKIYANIDVNKNNFIELAELYGKRRGIENQIILCIHKLIIFRITILYMR